MASLRIWDIEPLLGMDIGPRQHARRKREQTSCDQRQPPPPDLRISHQSSLLLRDAIPRDTR